MTANSDLQSDFEAVIPNWFSPFLAKRPSALPWHNPEIDAYNFGKTQAGSKVWWGWGMRVKHHLTTSWYCDVAAFWFENKLQSFSIFVCEVQLLVPGCILLPWATLSYQWNLRGKLRFSPSSKWSRATKEIVLQHSLNRGSLVKCFSRITITSVQTFLFVFNKSLPLANRYCMDNRANVFHWNRTLWSLSSEVWSDTSGVDAARWSLARFFRFV